MAFYTGHPGAAWDNSLFLGALADRNLIRLSLDGDRIVAEERLLTDLGKRIRDVRVGADGNVYVLTDEADGQLLITFSRNKKQIELIRIPLTSIETLARAGSGD